MLGAVGLRILPQVHQGFLRSARPNDGAEPFTLLAVMRDQGAAEAKTDRAIHGIAASQAVF